MLFLILPAAAAALRLPVTALPGPALFRPHRRALTIPSMMMVETGSGDAGPAALVGFASDRAAGLAVAGGLGFVAEKVASRVPISLSPLLYATAFGIAIGNTLRLIDPEMKAMAPTAIGLGNDAKREKAAPSPTSPVSIATLLDSPMPTLCCEEKTPHKIIALNPAWTAVCGYEPGEAVGLPPSLLLQSGKTNKLAASAFTRALLTGDSATVRLTNRTKQGA